MAQQQNYSALVVGEGQPKADAEKATGATWQRLFEQRHEDYDAELWTRLDLLHKGGYAIQKAADKFIDKAPQEPEQYYKWRCKTTSYINHMARVIGHLVGGLFGVPLKVSVETEDAAKSPATTPDEAFYKTFALDCDLKGTDFSQFMRERLVKALVQKRALIGVDMPVGEMGAVNRAQEEAQGVGRAWLYEIDLAAMLDWEVDDKNRFQWCKLVKKVYDRSDPLGNHSSYYYEFKIWKLLADGTSASGSRASYEVYRSATVTSDEQIDKDEPLEQVTPPAATSFKQIPIVNLELPEAVWAGNQLGPLCTEHYNGRSDLRGAMCRSLVEIPYVKRGPEIGGVHDALPSETQQNPSRGHDPVQQAKSKGFVALGSGDEIGFAGPSGTAFEMTAAELSRTREEIYGSMHTMALALANTASTVQRSGESKKEDRSATLVILDFLGDTVREMAQSVYDRVSDGRAEKAEWKASGVDSYDDEDRTLLIEEATEVGMLNIPSPTFHRKYLGTVAVTLVPKASQAEKAAILEEIEKNFTDEMAMPPKLPLDGGPGAVGGAGAKSPLKLPGLKPPKPGQLGA